MGERTEIAWCDATFNPWWGCTKVSPACDNCYAERDSQRWAPGLWGVAANRRFFGRDHWDGPLHWQRKAIKDHRHMKMFCASMADVFDNHPAVEDSRDHLWELIRKTRRLDWLLLTKRIGNVKSMLPEDWGDGYPNVWLGISVVNQAEADRDIVKLLETPAALRFLSVEPMLAAMDLYAFQKGICTYCSGLGELAASGPTTTFPEDDDGMQRCYDCNGTGKWEDNPGLDWVICGGESGPKARPLDPVWALGVRQFCEHAQVPFFMNQGSSANWALFRDFDTFPEALRVRQWPKSKVDIPIESLNPR